MQAQQPPVLIIGAGIVGLTLAQALRLRSIPHLLYDSLGPFEVHEEWALTIDWALGIFRDLIGPQSDLFARLPEALVPGAACSGDVGSVRLYDAEFGRAGRATTPPSERLRVRRWALRAVLLSGIRVQLSKRFGHVSRNDDGTVVAHFKDGSVSPPGSVVVGCDGARSAVRRMLLPNASANNKLPVRCMSVTDKLYVAAVEPIRKLEPSFMELRHSGDRVSTFFSFLEERVNTAHPEYNGYLCQIIISWPFQPDKDNARFGDVPDSDRERVAFMKARSKNWFKPFGSAIFAINDSQPNGTCKLALEDWDPQPWDNREGSVTMAGDSAHTMVGWRSDGFNHGLRDLQGLVQSLESLYKAGLEGDWVSRRKAAVDAYETEMRERTHVAVLAARQECMGAHEKRTRRPLVTPPVVSTTGNEP